VAAVFAPGLSDRFQFDIGRVAAQLAEVLLDRLHLDQRQAQRPLFAERDEIARRKFPQRHRERLKFRHTASRGAVA
jgi:hypothetical protein